MEPRGRDRWQPVANDETPKTADPLSSSAAALLSPQMYSTRRSGKRFDERSPATRGGTRRRDAVTRRQRESAIGESGEVDGDEPQFARVAAGVVLQPAVARAREHLAERHSGVG